jgi:hypothetical protein
MSTFEALALAAMIAVFIFAMESRVSAAFRREARAKEAAAKLRRQLAWDASGNECAAMLDALLRAAKYFHRIKPADMTQEDEAFGAVLLAIQQTARSMGGRAEFSALLSPDEEEG